MQWNFLRGRTTGEAREATGEEGSSSDESGVGARAVVDSSRAETGRGSLESVGTTARQDRVARGMVKLPPIPEFSVDNSSHHDGEAYGRWLQKLAKHAELQRWSEREKLLQFELYLAGKAESVYEVLSVELKGSYASATRSLGERLQPARREALTSAQLLRRRQRLGESVDKYVREFEHLFEKSYGHRAGLDQGFKEVLKRDLFVQGLLLKW